MGDNWETILDVCDKVKAITTGPKDCLRAVLKRLNHPNPHVAKQAVIVSKIGIQYFFFFFPISSDISYIIFVFSFLMPV